MSRWIGLAFSLLCASAFAQPLYSVPVPTAEQLAAPLVEGPARLGFVLPMDLDSGRDGAWAQSGRFRVWSAVVHADGARFLSLRFDRAVLPPGAQLTLSGSAGGEQGPYTVEDVRGGGLQTALVHGASATLRLRVPVDQEAHLHLGQVHAGLQDPLVAPRSKSGNCNIDVACEDADGHEPQVRSTVLLIYPVGNSLIACSGLLVNNTREDLTPYLLTARHCGINPNNAGSVEVYWRFQRNSCSQPGLHTHGAPDASFSTTGTQWLADDQASDFTLLLLGSAERPFVPPTRYEPYWSGWDIGGQPASSGVGVHHPQGDEKAISFFESSLRAATVTIDNREVRAWEVVWDQGTTEQGSSGSGLWNEVGRAVGLLSGGGASCSTPNEPDYYGRFNVAWREGSSCDAQLGFWLDPDGSGASRLDGAGLADAVANPRVPSCGDSPPVSDGDGGGGSGPLGLSGLLLAMLCLWRRRILRAGR